MSVPKTRMDFCGNLLEEATEESMVDHMSSFWDFDEFVDMAEPGRSSKPPERVMCFSLGLFPVWGDLCVSDERQQELRLERWVGKSREKAGVSMDRR